MVETLLAGKKFQLCALSGGGDTIAFLVLVLAPKYNWAYSLITDTPSCCTGSNVTLSSKLEVSLNSVYSWQCQ